MSYAAIGVQERASCGVESECCVRLQVTCAACNWNVQEGNDVGSALQVGVRATATPNAQLEPRGVRSKSRQRERCKVSLRVKSRRRSAARSGNGVQAHGGGCLAPEPGGRPGLAG